MAETGRFDVAVLGALHLDIMVRAPRLPVPDETVTGEDWRFKCGGKGGNQAAAAARAGAATAFAGRIGNDDFGRRLVSNLENCGVDCSRIVIDASQASGMSVAIEMPGGDYGAIIVSGANRGIAGSQLAGLSARVLLLQNEVPPDANLAAARVMAGAGARIVYNMAPFRPIDGNLLAYAPIIVLNRVEAGAMTGIGDPADAARDAVRRGCDAIVTAGEEGCYIATREGDVVAIAAPRILAASSHGAGDCFCGTLAAALARNENLESAARTAVDAAALHVAGG